MKPRCFSRWAGLVLSFSLTVILPAAAAPGKPIRLRNSLSASTATPPATAALAASAAMPAPGLFVIQFRESPKPAWRAQLHSLGVELLRYVPEDAYVARLSRANPAQIRELNFVQFVGAYGSPQKTHRRLQGLTGPSAKGPVEISLLLSPTADEAAATQAKSQFSALRQESKLRGGRVLRGSVAPAQLDALAASENVLWIEPAPQPKLNDEVASKLVAGDGGPNLLDTQLLGYDGSGVTVAVADSGLNNGDATTMHPDLLGRTPAFFHYGAPGQLDSAADEHSHGTHCAGIIAGDGASGEVDENGNLYGLGVAPGASIVAQRIFDGDGGYAPPPSFERLTRDAKRAGADIGSNSWGDDTQGRYDLSAMEFDELVRDADALTLGDQPYILEFSAGNAGPGQQTIGSPACAKNVIATGACQNDRLDFVIYADGSEAMADFSSRGPCEDGRIKPDVVAPGTWIASLQSESATDQYAWSPISPLYQFQGGTSQAGPHVSGCAAVFVQYYRETHANATPSPALVKAALINSTVALDAELGNAPAPNHDEGWGRVDLTQIMDSDRTFDFVDQSVLLTNAAVYERKILLSSSAEPLKVTLAYTDEPGFPGAIPALVNDLDLEVVAPDGGVYRGNQFDRGQSIANSPGRDSINNVEGIFIQEPVPGEYTLRVRARKVAQDAREDTLVDDQDFALVASGILAAPGQSVLFLDRHAYRAPDQIRIALVDYDRAGDASAAVTVRSTTETAGETFTLNAANSTGVFTGTVASVLGPVLTDGKLAVANQDAIEVRYADASAGATVTAPARADLVAPVITGIATTNEFGQTLIFWTTDEPANSVVRFGTNSGLNRSFTNSTLTLDHEIALSGLVSNQNYFFQVSSADEAGNGATNNNGGALFRFVGPTVAKVLLVEDYTDLLFGVPPLSGYTAPLTQIGISYDVWNTSTHTPSSPSLANLQPYQCVIWRLPEFVDTWTLTEQNALIDYVRDGGSLFVASMEVLTRLEEGGFNSTKLGLLKVQSNIVDNDPYDVPEVVGITHNPVGNGINTALDYAEYEDPSGIKDLIGLAADVSDTITPASDAEPICFDDAGEVTGLKFPRTGQNAAGRLVFLSFPLDAVPNTGTTNNRVELLRNILEFLVPGFDGRATVSLDQPSYGVPSTVVIEVDDADRAGSGSVDVAYASTAQPAGGVLTLSETPRRGTFRGTLLLVPASNPIADGTLRAANGQFIQVSYADTSSGTTDRATASVDTIGPEITAVTREPDYEQATISWLTSEPCDSLVQFGESQFLNRAAGSATLATEHEVILTGLQPDTTYYFQVVSRDAAGNVVTDDNHTNLFTVRTLTPLTTPWFENFNGAVTNWSTFDNDGSQSAWSLGVPANGKETTAHSAPRCWGSNLSGDVLDYAETFLISPAIQLGGGNVVKLNFWHSYDFNELSASDVFNAGTVYIVTGGGSELAPLAQYVEFNSGWEQESLDISAYAGRVVYFVWACQLFSFDSAPRPGWLVDDVSVTSTNIPGGTIQLTNNVWQANVFISGQASFRVRGRFAHLTNAPPGDYLVEYADIPFYQTPGAQTGTLTAGGTLNFTGNYGLVDANTNTIPDGWELAKFGTLSPGRSSLTDTDGDGQSDWAEFVAGTDPNNPPPRFLLTARQLNSGLIQLSWPSVTNHSYRVHRSSNLITWSPFSNWFGSAGTNTTFTLTATTNAGACFRVEAAPEANSPVAATFRTEATLLINRQVRLTWPSAPGHGYRLHGSANGTDWSPFTDWIRATGYSTGYTLPLPTNGAAYLFRVEAAP